MNSALEQLTLVFPHELEVGEVVLHLQFSYTLNQGLSGFYRHVKNRFGICMLCVQRGAGPDARRLAEVSVLSLPPFLLAWASSKFSELHVCMRVCVCRSTYTLGDGKQHLLATTQFEAASARSAFPCFDEPAMKAAFALEIIAPQEFQVLSNMPPREVHEVGGPSSGARASSHAGNHGMAVHPLTATAFLWPVMR